LAGCAADALPYPAGPPAAEFANNNKKRNSTMDICELSSSETARIIPLLQELHALHVHEQPQRHAPEPSDQALQDWLTEWLQQEGVIALQAQSPQGALLGYLIYELQERPALPVRAAERRAMLHHIAVQESWRRMGVGKALIGAMKARLATDGIGILQTTYAPFNAASAALMRGMGLEPVLITAEWRAGQDG
jgi:GNAT superfamily N-acetyltransferase